MAGCLGPGVGAVGIYGGLTCLRPGRGAGTLGTNGGLTCLGPGRGAGTLGIYGGLAGGMTGADIRSGNKYGLNTPVPCAWHAPTSIWDLGLPIQKRGR